MSVSRRSARARAHLAERDPALGLLALWCSHRDHDGATETEGETIRYAPGFDTLPLPEQVGTVAHHVLHVALRHSARAGEARARLGGRLDPVLYGAATDAIVNETLALAGHPLPRPAVTLAALLASAGIAVRDPLTDLAAWDADRLYAALTRDAPTRRRAREVAEAQGFRTDVVATGAGDVAPDEAAQDWAAHLARAAEAGKGAGSGIGPVLARLAAMAAPRVPWERVLRGLIAQALLPRPSESRARPARAWIAATAAGQAPPFQPARRASRMAPRVVVAVDTSSSVTPDQWHLFAAEIAGIHRRAGAALVLMGFDEAVHAETALTPGAPLPDMAMRRGGGTDLAPVMARAAQLAPSALVILTDADAAMPPAPPCAVIWCLPGPPPRPIPFGRVLELI